MQICIKWKRIFFMSLNSIRHSNGAPYSRTLPSDGQNVCEVQLALRPTKANVILDVPMIAFPYSAGTPRLIPPSTAKTWPVIHCEAGRQKSRIAWAISLEKPSLGHCVAPLVMWKTYLISKLTRAIPSGNGTRSNMAYADWIRGTIDYTRSCHMFNRRFCSGIGHFPWICNIRYAWGNIHNSATAPLALVYILLEKLVNRKPRRNIYTGYIDPQSF